MKNKKLSVAMIFLVLTIVAHIVVSVLYCYTTKPAITKGEFPFSITYEYKGERNTYSGVYKCEFAGSDTVLNEHRRYWNGEYVIENPGPYEIPNIIFQTEEETLTIRENMSAGYFMGDPLCKDYYTETGLDGVEPYVEYYDYVNEISLNDENKDEVLEAIDFKFIEFTYAEPIENSFSLSGVFYSGDNVTVFVMISLIFLILCMIFVRKDKEYKYSGMDKLGILFNFVIGIVAVPFITFFCMLYELIGGDDIIGQIGFNIPSITIICLALSVVFRRKEFRKTGLIIQFAGVVLFVLFILSDLLH